MKKKAFDCVEMKNKIQQQIMKEREGLTDEEWRRKTEKEILSDPILGPFVRKVHKSQKSREQAGRRLKKSA